MKENTFETIKRVDDNDKEYWSSRELAKVLEYSDYRKFLNVIDRAKTACENSDEVIHNHFVHKDEMVLIGSGAERSVDIKDVDKKTFDLSAKNPNKKEETILRTPNEIIEEMGRIDTEIKSSILIIKKII